MKNSRKIEDLLTRSVEEIIVEKDLRKKLESGEKLRIKHGVDPTGRDLHIGHAVIYNKLKEFQDMGHTVIFLIGGFTARFGDPTDKHKGRKLRTKEDVEQKAENYINQVSKILDIKKTEVRYNSEWYDKMSAEELLRIMSHFTVARMLERDMFVKRREEGLDIGLHEPVYPILQAYDSVMLKSDLTVIGTDQKFNELQARALQRDFKQVPQDVMTMKILVGTDGKKKMSKSQENYIGITEPAIEKFGKIMSIPDSVIVDYFELATKISSVEISEIKKSLDGGENPRDAKLRLAREMVRLYHGEKVSKEAEDEFIKIFKNKETPSD
ncbi:MAG: hypothetical protein ACD_63C00158G0001, partial [uncultured bacterium]